MRSMSEEYHVHIVTVGFDPEPSMDVGNSGIPVDKVYLLNDPSDERAADSEKRIVGFLCQGNIDVEEVVIDGYDFHSIYDKVVEIGRIENA